ITRQAPDYLPAWTELMRLTYAERKFDECKSVIDAILARDYYNLDALLQSADLAMRQHDPAKALGVLDRMETRYKTLPVVKYQMAMALLISGETPKAMTRLDEALDLDHNYSPAALMLA